MRSRLFAASLTVLAVLRPCPGSGPSPLHAQPSPEQTASRHHERATTYYNLGQFDDAIAEYRKAYEVLARPEFLFDIGQAYQQLGHFDKALFFYRRYLSTAPGAPNRAEVEARIAALEPTVPPEARLRQIPRNEPLSAPVVVPPSSPSLGDSPREEADGPRSRRRMWLWTALGVAVAGAAVGLFFFTRDGGGGPPRSDLGNARYF